MQLIVDDLTGRRGERLLFEGLSFTLGPGDGLLVTGPNGSGKSTLLRLIAGLLPVETGRIELRGDDGAGVDRSSIAFLGDHNAMKPALSVEENLSFWQSFSGGPNALAADPGEALAMVGLPETVLALPFDYLSKGQRRRAGLMRILLADAALWLLDEPASGLDRSGHAMLDDAIARHRRRGGLVVVASHSPVGGAETMAQLPLGAPADPSGA